MQRFARLTIISMIALFPAAASAHVGVGDTHGFVHGFSHPFSGVDHALTMMAVGILAARLGGRALWLLPLTFGAVMAGAGLMGAAGMTIPFVEIGISLSVACLGLVFALRLHLPTVAAAALVGLFAVFHGHAHGAEMPETASGLAYGAGFLCATALLHAVGIGLNLAAGKLGESYSQQCVRVGGCIMALIGIAILISMP